MTDARTQRIRDPIHGLIVFQGDNKVDQLAWELINTFEFLRLRRIKQMGVSEFVFPSATHTRFAHSIGVFHIARQLIGVIRREKLRELSGNKKAPKFNASRADVAVIAALLHDIGHGPFSHMFEHAVKTDDYVKNHEIWTREIIENQSGTIYKLLEDFRTGFCAEVASVFKSDVPDDIYAAVVSSSFDADRLDYMRRDRLMSGSGAGAIDFDWLIEHVRIGKVYNRTDDVAVENKMDVFCFDSKALPAAEQFLLSRFTMYEQVYFHKVTRCVEAMFSEILTEVAKVAISAEDAASETGLPVGHALLRFLSENGQTLENYLSMDDTTILGAFPFFMVAKNERIASLSKRLSERDLFKSLDIESMVGRDPEAIKCAEDEIDKRFASNFVASSVIKDDKAEAQIYKHIGYSEKRIHKKIYISEGGKPEEISKVSGLLKSLDKPRRFIRYYFETESDRSLARKYSKEEVQKMRDAA